MVKRNHDNSHSMSTESVKNPIISLDVMSGDLGPEQAIIGAAQVSLETPINVLLLGDKILIEGVLSDTPHNSSQISIQHTDSVITMHDSPKIVVEGKQDSSLFQAIKSTAENKTDAVVSAGNTGAFIVCASKLIPRIQGVKKTALSAVYPTQKNTPSGDRFALLLDVGATIKCTAEELVQFALMGNAYASKISRVSKPTIGLLNVGTEPHKGGEVLTKTYEYLSKIDGINFIGNVEGSDIPIGICDVIVCEGFVGNIALKLAEGMQNVLKHLGKEAFKRKFIWKLGIIMLASGLKQIKKITDYSEYGGAPILGYEKICIKAHGKSNAKAFKNAIKVAAKAVRGEVSKQIAESVQKFNQTYASSLDSIK